MDYGSEEDGFWFRRRCGFVDFCDSNLRLLKWEKDTGKEFEKPRRHLKRARKNRLERRIKLVKRKLKQGKTIGEIAKEMGKSRRTIHRWLKNWQERLKKV